MNVAAFVTDQLALFAFREGQRLSPGMREAKLGIANVIRNRLDAGWEGGDWLKIIHNAPVHAANNIEEMDFRSYVDIWSQDFRWLHDRCEQIYEGRLEDEITASADPKKAFGSGHSQRALFYGSLQSLTRQWFIEKIVSCPAEHPRLADAGTVTFFG